LRHAKQKSKENSVPSNKITLADTDKDEDTYTATTDTNAVKDTILILCLR